MKKILSLFMVCGMILYLASPVTAKAKDTTPPQVKAMVPVDKKNVPINHTMVITFNENIVKGKNFFDITLSDSEGFEMFFKYKISKNQFLIKAIPNMEYKTRYKLAIPMGAFADQSGNLLKKTYSFYFTTINMPENNKITVVDDPNLKSGIIITEQSRGFNLKIERSMLPKGMESFTKVGSLSKRQMAI